MSYTALSKSISPIVFKMSLAPFAGLGLFSYENGFMNAAFGGFPVFDLLVFTYSSDIIYG